MISHPYLNSDRSFDFFCLTLEHGQFAYIQKMTICKKDLYKIYKVYTEHLDIINKQSFEGLMY